MTVTMNPAQFGGLASPAPKDIGKQMALQLLRGTQGVEAWSDLTYEQTSDGKTHLKGTAYFPDLNKLQMSAGEAAGGAQASTLVSRKEGNDWVIEVGVTTKPPAGPKKAPTGDLKAAVQQAQQQWQASKTLMAPLVQDAKIKSTVTVGGTIKEAVGFSKENDNTALMQFNGSKVIEAVDKMMADAKGLEEAISVSGDAMGVFRDPGKMQKMIMESITDGQGLPRLVVTPGASVFDYKAEVAKVTAGQSAELKALITDSKKPKEAVVRPPGAGTAPGAGKVVPPKPKKATD